MLEAFHPRIRHFARSDGIRNVALERNFLFFGFVGDGENRVARNERLQFDEIGAAFFEVVDSAARVVGSGDGDGTWETRLGAVEHGAGSENARTNEAAGFDFVAPVLEDFQLAAHVANAGNAVGDEERKRDFLRAGKPIAENQMNVHVPQAGNEKESAAIEGWRVARILDGLAGTDRFDVILVEDDGLILQQRAGAHVDDGNVVEDEQIVERRFLGQQRSAQKK